MTDYYWDAAAAGNASVDTNWSPVGVPGSGDTLIFTDANSVKDCSMNIAEVTTLNMISSYTGTVTLANGFTISGDLTISAGTLDTGADKALTVGGNIILTPTAAAGTAENSTLICNGSDVTVTGRLGTDGTWYGGDNSYTPKSIFIGGTGDHEYNSMTFEAGTDATLSSGITELKGEDGGAAFRLDIQNGYNTYSNGSGTVKFTSATLQKLYSTGQSADDFTQFYNLILEKTSSTLQGLSTVGFHIKVENDLTITSGILNTNTTTGVNHDLTVEGTCKIDGTLTGNSSDISVGALNINGGTFSAPDSDGSTTLTSDVGEASLLRIVSGGGSGLVNNDGTITIQPTGGIATYCWYHNTTSTHPYNLIINCSGGAGTNMIRLNRALTAEGDLTVTAGTLNTNNSAPSPGGDYSLTVDGATTIGEGSSPADQATLVCNSSSISLGSEYNGQWGLQVEKGGTFVGGTGAHTFGSLKLGAAHADVKCTLTTGVTTIDDEKLGDNYTLFLQASTFDNADGTVTITHNADARFQINGAPLNNVIINHADCEMRMSSDAVIDHLEITTGTFNTSYSGTDYDLTLGNFTIDSGGELITNDSVTTIAGNWINNGGNVG